MSKEKNKREKISLIGYDPVEEPEIVIASDKNDDRRKAFSESYKKIMQIIPEYFIFRRKKRKGTSSSGGNAFTQNIIVTPENVKVERQEVEEKEVIDREKERE